MPEVTALGYPYPENPDHVDVAIDIQELAEFIDGSPGIRVYNQNEIDYLPDGRKRAGLVVFNSTTGKLQKWTGTAWTSLATEALVTETASTLSTAIATASSTAASALSNHSADTTDVHGIADTSALATKAYADTAAANAAAAVVDAAPATLDTLNELAAALNDDANFATTVSTALAGKASLTDLSTHASDSTDVHGIADTADLVLTGDSRLTNARTPTSHAVSHAQSGSDPITPGSIGAAADTHTHDYAAAVHDHSQYASSTHTHDFAAHDHPGLVHASVVDAAGDLLVGSADDTVGRLPAGPDGYILKSLGSGEGVNRIGWVNPFGSQPVSPELSDALPQPPGVASAGIAVTASRSDHVHAVPFGGLQVQVAGAEPDTAAGYLWVDTTVEV